MKQILRGLTLLIALCNCNFLLADPITDIYQIEVIVFEHTNADRFKAEHWPKFVGKLETIRAVDLDNLKKNVPESLDTLDVLDALDEAGDKPANKQLKETITLVEPKNYLMINEERLIKTSKVERFITHIAWMQPLASNVKSTPVYFHAGKDNEFTALIAIKPVRNVYTMYIDAIYKIQSEDQKDDPGVEEIRLVRDLRMKRKEVFYVDHPVIGMMITISPVVYGTNSYSPLP